MKSARQSSILNGLNGSAFIHIIPGFRVALVEFSLINLEFWTSQYGSIRAARNVPFRLPPKRQ